MKHTSLLHSVHWILPTIFKNSMWNHLVCENTSSVLCFILVAWPHHNLQVILYAVSYSEHKQICEQRAWWRVQVLMSTWTVCLAELAVCWTRIRPPATRTRRQNHNRDEEEPNHQHEFQIINHNAKSHRLEERAAFHNLSPNIAD